VAAASLTGRMRLPLPPRPSIRAPERKAAPKDGLLWAAPTEDAHVPESDDEAQAFKRLLFNKRKRTLLHLMRMLEAKAATMAHQATCARRRRRGPQGQPKALQPSGGAAEGDHADDRRAHESCRWRR